MGVDSGLPDFRGNSGFWRAYPAIARMGQSFSQMANPVWFDRDPTLAWAFYGHRLNLYRQTRPHDGFSRLLDKAHRLPGGCFVLTSNVDGQFQKAGFDADRVEECHGSIHHLQCSRPCSDEIENADGTEVRVDLGRFRALPPLPECRRCGAVARPNILMFGDDRWLPERTQSQTEALGEWLRGVILGKQRLVVVEIGAGLAIPTIRLRSENHARRAGGQLIRINPRDEAVTSPEDMALPLGGAEGTAAILP
ncbi:MAG: NAD-dependent deacetylase [Magnetococcales bacterium]|nr:NAD-dependent deacetylase [Magnetococcales bacterium]